MSDDIDVQQCCVITPVHEHQPPANYLSVPLEGSRESINVSYRAANLERQAATWKTMFDESAQPTYIQQATIVCNLVASKLCHRDISISFSYCGSVIAIVMPPPP